MNTKIIRLKYLITAILICLISGNVWGQNWIATDIAELTSSDIFVIVDVTSSRAMSNDKGTSTAPTAVAVTLNSDKTEITSTVADNLKWNISTTSGNYTFYPIGTTASWLYCTASNNGVRVGTNSNKTFSWDASNNKLKNAETSRWVGVYVSGSDWRCYTTADQTNIKNTVTKFFKYTEAVSSVAAPTISPKSGNFENSQEVTITPAEGTTVYYTTDGNDPDNISTLYERPFTITKTTTVKAIAYKDTETSEIVSATYTKVLPAPTFTFSNENISINLGETFTAPTLTNTSDGTVTYTSSNTELATITNDGAVTLAEGASGTTTITASVTETETYAAASASYTLTVVDPNNLNFTYEFAKKIWTENGIQALEGINWNLQLEGSTYFGNFDNGKGIQLGTSNIPATSIKLSTNDINGTIKSLKIWTSGAKNINATIATTVAGIPYGTPQNITTTNTMYEFEGDNSGNIEFAWVNEGKAAIYIKKIEISYRIILPSSTTDPITKAMTLTGAWTADKLAALDLTGINSLDMTGISVPTGVTLSDTRNPNCIVYVSYDDIEKAETLPNAVIVDQSGSITYDKGIQLTDGYDFHNKTAFNGNISYTRNFLSGWNTFALPFPTEITAGDEIEEFNAVDGNTIRFKKASTLAANTPYLINIATAGEKTFTATGAYVPVTAPTGETYKSSFTKLTGGDMTGKYILVLEEDKEVFAPATTAATLPAFRGYLELPQVSGIRYSIAHDQGGATNIETNNEEGVNIYAENGILNIHTNVAQTLQIRSIDGRTIQRIQLAEDSDIRINNLAKGIYLVNNMKVIIK